MNLSISSSFFWVSIVIILFFFICSFNPSLIKNLGWSGGVLGSMFGLSIFFSISLISFSLFLSSICFFNTTKWCFRVFSFKICSCFSILAWILSLSSASVFNSFSVCIVFCSSCTARPKASLIAGFPTSLAFHGLFKILDSLAMRSSWFVIVTNDYIIKPQNKLFLINNC